MRTSSGTGSKPRRGFSLIELMIVIALAALAGGLVVVNAQAILRGLGEEPVERVLQRAVREARFQAAALKQPVRLRFDPESATFTVTAETGGSLASFPAPKGDSGQTLRVEFEQILPSQGLTGSFIGPVAPVAAVTFRPDRSSTPFQVVLTQGSQSFTQRFDPFSDVVIHDSRQP